ncbi:MAG: cupin domain-containing protein [Nitrososphaerales archaeon]
MKKVELKDAISYQAPGHFGCTALRLQHKDTTGTQSFTVGLSHFLPGGGAEMATSEFERVYYVISGTITVTDSEGRDITLGPTDSLYIAIGERRSVLNKTNQPVSMLVIGSYPKK